MNQRLDRYLCRKFPLLFADRHADMSTTAMCWGFSCGAGWYRIIKEAAEKLEPLVAAYKARDPVGYAAGFGRAAQVKEKFGTLRFYLTGGTDEMYEIVTEAERKSAKTCEECGGPGKRRGRSWIYTSCQKHVRAE